MTNRLGGATEAVERNAKDFSYGHHTPYESSPQPRRRSDSRDHRGRAMPMTPPLGFLTVGKHHGLHADKPRARFMAGGYLVVHANLVHSLGSPEWVYVYLNPETRKIALGPAEPGAAGARRFSSVSKNAKTRRICLVVAYHQVGWQPQSATVVATITDGLAFLDVPADETSPNGR
jgi:hypothetical protein